MRLCFLTLELGCQHRTTPKGSAPEGCPLGSGIPVTDSLLYTSPSLSALLVFKWLDLDLVPFFFFPFEVGVDPRNGLWEIFIRDSAVETDAGKPQSPDISCKARRETLLTRALCGTPS